MKLRDVSHYNHMNTKVKIDSDAKRGGACLICQILCELLNYHDCRA